MSEKRDFCLCKEMLMHIIEDKISFDDVQSRFYIIISEEDEFINISHCPFCGRELLS